MLFICKLDANKNIRVSIAGLAKLELGLDGLFLVILFLQVTILVMSMRSSE